MATYTHNHRSSRSLNPGSASAICRRSCVDYTGFQLSPGDVSDGQSGILSQPVYLTVWLHEGRIVRYHRLMLIKVPCLKTSINVYQSLRQLFRRRQLFGRTGDPLWTRRRSWWRRSLLQQNTKTKKSRENFEGLVGFHCIPVACWSHAHVLVISNDLIYSIRIGSSCMACS